MTSFNVLQNNLNELSLLKMAEILPNVIDKSVIGNISLQDSLLELTIYIHQKNKILDRI